MLDPINVCVTGAAGQIAYSLLFSLARGEVFGNDQPLNLRLLDIEPMMGKLKGVEMELDDCVFELLSGVVATSNAAEAFEACDVALLVGAFPRRDGMLRKDLLAKNVQIFKDQGEVLDKVAKKSVKVLVVGNPANTNALICSLSAPSIPPTQFTALTQLDHNRATSMIAKKVGVKSDQVKNVMIWGNHSATQYPCVDHAYVVYDDGKKVPVSEAVNDQEWIETEFTKAVQTRGAAVIKARGFSSAMSAAKAIGDHMKNWWSGTKEGEWTSMCVMSDGSYGLEKGLIYSHPVTCKDGVITIVPDLEMSEHSKKMMTATEQELMGERETATSVLK
eukprot:m.10757 g.10757  ORF g.10757 m.10757 type:complete len:333 (-) comp6687_c0_seq1:69-1067(-)